MTIEELLSELKEQPSQEIQVALLELLNAGKLDFTLLANAYIKYLESENIHKKQMLADMATCIAESFFCKKGNKTMRDRNHTLRCLYLLEKTKFFSIYDLKKKYNYNEEEVKKLFIDL